MSVQRPLLQDSPGRRCSFDGETIGEFPTFEPCCLPRHRHLRHGAGAAIAALMTCHIVACLPLFDARWKQVVRRQGGSRSPVSMPSAGSVAQCSASRIVESSAVVSSGCSRLGSSATTHPWRESGPEARVHSSTVGLNLLRGASSSGFSRRRQRTRHTGRLKPVVLRGLAAKSVPTHK